MPICYGGGVKSVEQAQKIFGLGIEKIALSSSVIGNMKLISKISERVGTQSVIVVLDIKRNYLEARNIPIMGKIIPVSTHLILFLAQKWS